MATHSGILAWRIPWTEEPGELQGKSIGSQRVGPSTSAGDFRELTRVPLRGEECCGVGGASRDSSGFGAIEEGLISRGDRTSGAPPRHAHGDLTSLAPHERLPEILVVLFILFE